MVQLHVAILTSSFICGDQPSSVKSSACCDVSMSGDDEIELEKSNILLIGPTGSGTVDTCSFYYFTIVMLSVC